MTLLLLVSTRFACVCIVFLLLGTRTFTAIPDILFFLLIYYFNFSVTFLEPLNMNRIENTKLVIKAISKKSTFHYVRPPLWTFSSVSLLLLSVYNNSFVIPTIQSRIIR